jgi:hypothetical protein
MALTGLQVEGKHGIEWSREMTRRKRKEGEVIIMGIGDTGQQS